MYKEVVTSKNSPLKKVKIKNESPKKQDSPHKKYYFTDSGEKPKLTLKPHIKEKIDLKHAIKSLNVLRKYFLKIVYAVKGVFCSCNYSDVDKNDIIT